MKASTPVWVHIGLPKCGSTTIQRYFSNNSAMFRDQGLCYPETGRSKGGYQSHEPIARANPAQIPRIVEAIAHEARSRRQIIISCEDFANALPQGNASALVAALNQTFGAEQVRMIAYFRNIYDFVESCYAQFILGGLFKVDTGRFFRRPKPDLDSFVEAFETLKGFPLYSALGHASLIARHFPENTVILKSIERSDLGGIGLVEDICRTIGVEAVDEVPAQNTRASNLLLAAAHYARCHAPPDVYKRTKPQLRKLASRPKWEARAKAFNWADLHIGSALHDRIVAQIAAERVELAERFASDVEKLCEDRWVEPKAGDSLSDNEKSAIGHIIASATQERDQTSRA